MKRRATQTRWPLVFWMLLVILVLANCKSGSGSGDDEPDGDTDSPITQTDGDDGDDDDDDDDDDDGDQPEDGDQPVSCDDVGPCQEGEICAGGVCSPCSVDAQCLADYGAGATCEDGVCKAALCPDGSLSCPCDEGSCTEGECVQGTCTDCERGSIGCVCMNNGTCDLGARCNESNLCEACPAGEEGCPCAEDDACDGELICDEGLCIVDPCPQATEGCRCAEDESCNDGLYCTESSLCAACSNDVVDCPCDDEQQCENDLVCDDESDLCRDAIRCADLNPACQNHQLCEEPVGQDASCMEACEDGWTWNTQTHSCEELPPEPTCTAGVEGSILAQCEGQHRNCVQETDTAHCGACKADFLDESGSLTVCRAVVECTGLDCASQNRECTEHTENADAFCGDCLSDYLEDQGGCYLPNCEADAPGSLVASCQAEHRSCVNPPDASASCGGCLEGYAENDLHDCQRITSCAASDLNCEGKLRSCEGDWPFQQCGDCVSGAAPDPANPEACRTPLTCAELDCEEGQICREGSTGENAYCETPQCEEGQAWTEYGTPRCVTCYVDCSGGEELGYTGRIWPYTEHQSLHCMCETLTGFYWEPGDNPSPRRCDRDNDGWVRDTARPYLESTDDALKENARCSLRTVDRFTLQNEYNQRLDIRLCGADGVYSLVREGNEGDCTSFATLDLYESVRNDDQVTLESGAFDTLVPSYIYDDQGTQTGRKLRAKEVNSLTKACVSKTADYNDNDLSDITEWQTGRFVNLSEDEVMNAFSYFVELHRAWYEGVSGLTGRYVISERSRCETDFAVTYGDSETSQYWRECTRNRDASFNGNGDPEDPNYGLDFATWSCDTHSGSCPVPPPPTNNPPNVGLTPNHGLCNAAPLPEDPECDASGPWFCVENDEGQVSVWRGMNHHSQFQCVVVNNESSTEEPRVTMTDVALSGGYRFNACGVACPPGDESCSSDCAGEDCADSSEAPSTAGSNPNAPRIACAVSTTPGTDQVGFVSIRYPSYDGTGAYEHGCINEWTPKRLAAQDPYGENDQEIIAWRSLCPGWTTNPHDTIGQGDGVNFGQLQCGCGNNYGGYSCEQGCPDDQLHLSSGYQATPRSGYWLCGDVAMSNYVEMDAIEGPALIGNGYSLRGEIPSSTIGGGTDLCENEGCTSGFSIR